MGSLRHGSRTPVNTSIHITTIVAGLQIFYIGECRKITDLSIFYFKQIPWCNHLYHISSKNSITLLVYDIQVTEMLLKNDAPMTSHWAWVCLCVSSHTGHECVNIYVWTCLILPNAYTLRPDKMMLSSANDGLIIVWGSGGSKVDEVNVSVLTLKSCVHSSIYHLHAYASVSYAVKPVLYIYPFHPADSYLIRQGVFSD